MDQSHWRWCVYAVDIPNGSDETNVVVTTAPIRYRNIMHSGVWFQCTDLLANQISLLGAPWKIVCRLPTYCGGERECQRPQGTIKTIALSRKPRIRTYSVCVTGPSSPRSCHLRLLMTSDSKESHVFCLETFSCRSKEITLLCSVHLFIHYSIIKAWSNLFANCKQNLYARHHEDCCSSTVRGYQCALIPSWVSPSHIFCNLQYSTRRVSLKLYRYR